MRAQVGADDAADLGGMGDDTVERAVLRQPFDGGLRADLGHARHVVDAVAHQRQVIDDARGRHAELGQHAGLVEQLVRHGIDEPHLRVHELGQILVAGGNQHGNAGGGGLPRQGADDVVGLDAVDHDERPAQRADARVQRFDLGDEVVGHGRAMRLVFGIPCVAEGLALGVEDHGAVNSLAGGGLVVGFEAP